MRRFLTPLVILANTVLLAAQPAITVKTDQPGIPISPLLWGVFFEDLNWAADGGLYAELVQNRSFEYVNMFGSNFTAITAWSVVQRGGASAGITLNTQSPLNAVNSHYITISVSAAGSGAGLSNAGFAGIPVKSGDTYHFSFFARRGSGTAPFTISLESTSGSVYGTATVPAVTGAWKKYTADISANATDNNARLVILTIVSGNTDLDMISLLPGKTFKDRENGLRADLVQRLADMKPGFLRFPGGCIVHSNNLATAYRWKTTIGPVEERKNNANRWGYMQTCGLGFYEFFLLCEDLGAKPLPVLPVGVSCHYKTPYEVTPLDSLQPWIDDALDLIEYANGPVTSIWGAKRSAAGHPAPFNLEYLGVGNEEWGKEFKDRSDLFISAIRQKYPSIKIVGTAGPSASGSDYDDLWVYNRTKNTDVVDEHYYMDTTWFIHNTHRYDGFARSGPKVFAGEYASRSPLQKKLGNAIAEAAFMTGLERNSDVVPLSCYAPLFRNVNCNGSPAEGPWDPCLVYFDNNRSYVTPSYHVQSMFANNTGHRSLPVAYSASGASTDITGGIGLATWNTQAEFDDVQVTGSTGSLFSSDFTGAASSWTPRSGTWNAAGGVYAQTSTATDVRSVAGNVAWSNYTFSLRARKTGGNEGFLIMFGRKDDQNFYWWNLGGWANTKHGIEQCAAGTTSLLASAPGSITANQWYAVKIELAGNRIRCFLNDSLVHEIQTAGSDGPLYCVSSKDTVTGDIILKVVNTSASAITATLQLQGGPSLRSTGAMTMLSSPNVNNENTFVQPATVAPVTSTLTDVTPSSQRLFPAYSAVVLRFATQALSTHRPENTAVSRFADFTFSPRSVPGSRSGNVLDVRWTQAKSGVVTLKLYDCSGKMVAAVIRNGFYGPGTHHFSWAGSPGKPIGHGLFILSASIDGQGVAAVFNQTGF